MNTRVSAHEKYWEKEAKLNFSDYERNQVIQQLINPGELVIDIGCGDGAVAEYLTKTLKAKVVGIDFSKVAALKTSQRSVPVLLANAEFKLPLKSSSVDVVFMGDLIEHVYYPDRTLKEAARVLKNKGRIIVSCPNMGYWRYRVHYFLKGIIPETEWIEKELWNSQHIRFFNKSLLYKILRQTGFIPNQFIGISRRRLDKPLLNIFPANFGMIMVVVAKKQ